MIGLVYMRMKKRKQEKKLGSYYFRTSIGAAVGIIITGYLVDFLMIGSIFYIASLLYAWSGCLYFKKA